MATFSKLPPEIWLNITQYLPNYDLLYFKHLNSFFLHLAMDYDWARIKLDTRYPDDSVLVLSRMADPFVAQRTTKLNLCLRDQRTALYPWSRAKYPALLTNFNTARVQPKTTTTTQASVMKNILHVLPLLQNLTTLKIELLLIPLNLIHDLIHTLTTSSIAKSIKKLSLTAHLDLLASLVDSPNPQTTFPNLSALEIHLLDRNNEDEPKGSFNSSAILNLACFILSFSLSLSLHHLYISSLMDISPLFNHLSSPLHENSPSPIPLPNLKSISLAPFNFTFRNSPQSVHNFLLIHSTTIHRLQLNMTLSCWPLGFDMDKVLADWLFNFIKDVTTTHPSHFFPNLQSLDISPPTSEAGLAATVSFIKKIAHTLTSLRIHYRGLRIEGAQQVISALKPKSSKLKSLEMDISDLTLPFLDLLATKLPRLQNLSLHVEDTSKLSKTLIMLLLENRRYEISSQDDCFTSWNLRSLSIQGGDWGDVQALLSPFIPSAVMKGDDDDDDDSDLDEE